MDGRSVRDRRLNEQADRSSSRRRPARAILATLAFALAAIPAADAHAPGYLLYGSGTAVVDGVLTPGEWANAARVEFAAALPAHDGGGAVSATLLAMFVGLYFDTNHNGATDAGEDAVGLNIGQFSGVGPLDWFYPQLDLDVDSG